jgi:hypothetical protein
MKNIIAIAFFITSMQTAFSQSPLSHAEDEAAVKSVVEQFLKVAGNYNVAAMRPLFFTNANIGWHSLKEGKWIASSVTAEAWFERIGKIVNPKPYTEPVFSYTIHISEGRLAFVKADAILQSDDKPKAHNMDFFILMKENDTWKILSGSYTSVPIK